MHSVVFETDRISEGQFSASDLHGIDADIHITVLDDFTVSDDSTALDDHTASDDVNGPYDSELEVSETQIDTLETGEMSNDEFDCVLAFGPRRSVAPDSFHLR